jgi:hypothetical protein
VLKKLRLEIKGYCCYQESSCFFRILLLNIIERSCKFQRIHLCLTDTYKISSKVDCALFCAVVFALIKNVYYSVIFL